MVVSKGGDRVREFIKGFKEGFKDVFGCLGSINMKFFGELIGFVLAINLILWSFVLFVIGFITLVF